LKYIELLFL